MLRHARLLLLPMLAFAGCADRTPPPPQVAVPRDASEGPIRRFDPVKPMPRPYEPGRDELAAPPFDDPALIDQEIPEQAAFVAAYQAVGRPVIVIEGTGRVDAAADADSRPIAVMLAEWMRAGGAVMIVTARGQRANPDVVIELATNDGGGNRGAVNIVARASNVVDNTLLGQAMVDMPTPADRQAINRYTRFLARKLMTDMTEAWRNFPPPAEGLGMQERAPTPLPTPETPTTSPPR